MVSQLIFMYTVLTVSGVVLVQLPVTVFVLCSGRHHESGRRPWFMQSVSSRSQHMRVLLRGVNTSAQVSE